MSEITFKQVQNAADIEITAILADEIWHEHYQSMLSAEQIDYMVNNLQSPRAIARHIEEGFEYYLISYKDGTPAGYFAIEKRETYLYLSKFYIGLAFRGRGYGRETINKIVALAKNYGYNEIRLSVNKYNNASISAYEKMGFKNIESIVTDIGENFVMDDFIMQKTF